MTTRPDAGWQCPVCLVVYAPQVTKCECAKYRPPGAYASASLSGPPDVYVPFLMRHVDDDDGF